jgi:hypothetical protein
MDEPLGLPDRFWDAQVYFDHEDGTTDDRAHTLDLFALTACALAKRSLEDAQRVMVYANALVYDGRFDPTCGAVAALQRLAEATLRQYHADDLILDKVSSILTALQATEPARILPTLLVVRTPRLRVQRNVLDLLVRTLDIAAEDADTLEEVRQYVMYTMECHPGCKAICLAACALLMQLQGCDEQQIAVLLKVMQAAPELRAVQVAGCSFFGRARPGWLAAPHEKAVMHAMSLHGGELLLLGLKALEACAAGACGGGDDAGGECTCTDILDTALSVACMHKANRRLQLCAMYVLVRVLGRGCPTVTDATRYMCACRQAMDTHASDVCIQDIGARMLRDAIRGDRTVAADVAKATAQALLRALLVFPHDEGLALTALPALTCYNTASDAATDHELVAAACAVLWKTWKEHELLLASIMLLLATGLKLSPRAQADVYADAVAAIMACAKAFIPRNEACTDLYCRIAFEWGAMREAAAHQYLPTVLVAMKAHSEIGALQGHGVRAIRALIQTIPLTVALCNDITARLGKAMPLLTDSYLLLSAVQSLHTMLTRCPKAGKRFLSSEAFRIMHRVFVQEPKRRPPPSVMAACQVLFRDLVKRHPHIKALLVL